jgi:hypothetical protein
MLCITSFLCLGQKNDSVQCSPSPSNFPFPHKPGPTINHKKDSSAKPRLLNNILFIEILGNGRYPSLNYERILLNKKYFYLSCRLGFSYFYKQRNDYWILKTHKYDFPFLINGLFQIRKHFLIETGVGVTQQYYKYVADDYENGIIYRSDYHTTWLTASIGARIQVKHVMVSVAFTPLFNLTNRYKKVFSDFERSGYGIDPMFGLRIGYCFGQKK